MNDICAVIVTYRPDDAFMKNVKALLPQVDEIVVVDNGSRGAARSHLRQAGDLPRVSVITNLENLGIAAALNIGIRLGISHGRRWVATFDQDSLAPPDYMESLLRAYGAAPERERVALIAPGYRDQRTGVVQRRRIFMGKSLVAGSAITSGSLVDSRVFATVGFFDERLFMDFVDMEFNLRLMKNGFRIVKSAETVLDHNLGDSSRHRFLGKTICVTNHDSSRVYYKTRNRIIVNRRYLSSFPGFVAYDALKFLKEIARISIFEQDVVEKLTAIARGIGHGFSGRTGRLECARDEAPAP